MSSIYLEPDQVPAHLKGDYRGKMFRAVVTTKVTIPSDAGLWSSGSRTTYSAIELATGRTVAASDNVSSPWNEARQERTIELKPGLAVVSHIIFQGKDLGLMFHVHPDDATKMLPAPDDLSPSERKVLAIIKGIKSSYRANYYAVAGLTAGEVEAIKARLMKGGYLTLSGAATVKGKNAAGNTDAYGPIKQDTVAA